MAEPAAAAAIPGVVPRQTGVTTPVASAVAILSPRDRLLAWRDRLVASPVFQRWAARFPLTRPIARRRSRVLFDLCAGFVYTQVLRACVELDLFSWLAAGPQTRVAIAERTGLAPDAVDRLVGAAIALDLLQPRSGDRVGLGSVGAPLASNPGLRALIAHNALLYEDMLDPVALLRGSAGSTALARYYPYATPDSAPVQSEVAPYSALMTETAAPLIAELLEAYSFASHRRVMDVGGGEGRFARALAGRWPHLEVTLFDLPAVAELAARLGHGGGEVEGEARIRVCGGDFRSEALPGGFDAVTVIRILLDHDDDTVRTLLRRIREALVPGGRLIVVEPMAGVRGARTVGDAYFPMYLLAMGSGTSRSVDALRTLCLESGFRRCETLPTHYPVSTGILVART